jgi:hypothetical protein
MNEEIIKKDRKIKVLAARVRYEEEYRIYLKEELKSCKNEVNTLKQTIDVLSPPVKPSYKTSSAFFEDHKDFIINELKTHKVKDVVISLLKKDTTDYFITFKSKYGVLRKWLTDNNIS